MSTPYTAAELSRVRRGRVLTAPEQERAMVFAGRGLSRDDIIKKLRISKATWQNTVAEVPEFKQAWENAQAGRLEEIELTAYKLALGGTKTVRLTYTALLSRDGTPVRDDEGRPKMILNKREVTITPPTWEAVRFLLMARMPDVYSTKALAHDHNGESLDTIRGLLEAKLKASQTAPPIALPPAAEQGGA